jgi:hypothetical protein
VNVDNPDNDGTDEGDDQPGNEKNLEPETNYKNAPFRSRQSPMKHKSWRLTQAFVSQTSLWKWLFEHPSGPI